MPSSKPSSIKESSLKASVSSVALAPETPARTLQPDGTAAPESKHEHDFTEDQVSPTASSAGNDDDDDDEGMRGFKLYAIITGITLSAFLMHLDTTILAIAIPRITTQFHSITNIGWYGAAYQLASAAMQPLTGKLYANFPTKATFVSFVCVFELGSLLCGAAQSSNMLIVGRAVAGLGTSGIQNGVFTIVAACVPMPRRPGLIGVIMGVASFGLVVGPVVGGLLTEYTTWRWCFYINLPCGALVAALLCLVNIPEPVAKPPRLEVLRDLHNKVDLVGFALFAPACVMLLLAVQWGGNQYPWDGGVVIGLFVGSGVNALAWLAWDVYRGDGAMIPVSMVRQRDVWSGCLTFGLLMGPMFCAAYYLPIYFQSVKGASAALSGVYMLPGIVSQLVAAVVVGKVLQRVGYYLPFSIFSAVLMSVGYGLLSTFSPSTSTGRWIGYQIIFGAGRGIGIQMPLVAIQHTTSPAQIPIAIALAFFTGTFGSALCLSFADTIFTNSLRSSLQSTLSPSTVTDIIQSGGVGFRHLLTSSQLPVVLRSYCVSIDRVFYMLAAWVALSFFTAMLMGWKDIRRKAKPVSNA